MLAACQARAWLSPQRRQPTGASCRTPIGIGVGGVRQVGHRHAGHERLPLRSGALPIGSDPEIAAVMMPLLLSIRRASASRRRRSDDIGEVHAGSAESDTRMACAAAGSRVRKEHVGAEPLDDLAVDRQIGDL